MLQFIGSQRVGHDLVTEQKQNLLISVHLSEILNSLYQNSGIIYCKMILTAYLIF